MTSLRAVAFDHGDTWGVVSNVDGLLREPSEVPA
jgi:hypothetical protein